MIRMRPLATLLGLVACIAVLAPMPVQADARQARRACRAECGDAIAACIHYKSAPLLAAAVDGRRLRRKAKRIRRLCTKRAVRRCRADGPVACTLPLFCECET
jgi:hypothetical protein